MIKSILELLASDDFYGGTETIEIAKGRYELKESLKQAYKQGKRAGYGTK